MSSPECSSNHSQDDSSLSGGYFARYSDSGSPFDISQDEVQEEDILANIGLQDEPSGYFSDESDEDIPEELTKDFVDENMGDTVSNKMQNCACKKYVWVSGEEEGFEVGNRPHSNVASPVSKNRTT
uniref:(California timema) hypothetical protein n=1 Tax=Timema californicum TaxID=61474 RepID=A0A7R9J4I9_TIMCA|nr:unnamed protein product [Timema californicum]